MATYTRQSAAGIVDGGTIEASDLNDEFDQLASAFLAPTFGSGTAGTDIVMTFDGESADGVITWMEDEDLFKFSDAINVGVDGTGYDVKFFGDTASSYWLWDESADGVVQIGTLTVGVDDAGHDVKFFGNTASAYMLWDTSTDDLVLAGAAQLYLYDAGGGERLSSDGTDMTITSGGVINFAAGGTTNQVKVTDGALLPITDNDVDLGSSSYQFKDGYINGTLEADAITIGGTAIGSIYGVVAGSSSIVTTGALDSGSITSGFGAIDNGTSGIRTNTFTAETSLVPDASGGADIGTTALEWGDIFIADDKYIKFGSDQNVIVGYDEDGNDSLEFKANVEAAALAFTFSADQADDNADTWKLNFADGGTITWQSYTSGSFATKLTLDTSGNLNIAGELQATNIGYTDGDNAMTIADGGAVTFAQIPVFPSDTVETADIQDNAVSLAKMAGLTRGKIIYGDASGDPAALTVGSNDYVLTSDGTDISWAAAAAASSLASDDLSVGDAAVTLSTSSGNITVDATANNSDIIFKGTDATADITMLTLDGSEAGKAIFNAGLTIADGGTIGSASDSNSIAIASDGVVTMDQIPVFSAGINVSGGTIAGTLATAAQGSVTSLGTLTALTIDNMVHNGDSIVMTPTSGDTVTMTAATNGAFSLVTVDTAAAAANIQITADGTAELAGTTVTLDSAGDIVLDAAGNNITFKSGGTAIFDISNSSSDTVLKPMVNAKDIIFQQYDGTEVMRIDDAALVDMSDHILLKPILKDYGEVHNAIGDTGGGTDDIDLTAGNVVSATVSTGTQTFTFSDPTASANSCSFLLILTNGGSQTVNWPGSVDWAGGTAPTLTSSGADILVFTTVNGGTLWHGAVASTDSK